MSTRRRKPGKKAPRGEVQRSTGVRAKKHLGQHFLRDESVAARIAATLERDAPEHILEIGPGTGILTRHLLRYPAEILAVDLDADSVAYLREALISDGQSAETPDGASPIVRGTLEVRHADFLKMDLSQAFRGHPFALIGNFPYNISTQIVFRLLDYRDRIPVFSGMFQREVAERICSGPGSKAYGILSVLAQAYYTAEYCFTVPPEVFDPPPRVESGVLILRRRDPAREDWDYARLHRLVRTAFNQRRKTLRNSLKTLGFPENLKEGAIFDRRPEQLTVPEFIALSKCLSDDSV